VLAEHRGDEPAAKLSIFGIVALIGPGNLNFGGRVREEEEEEEEEGREWEREWRSIGNVHIGQI
jgi:hypothetical protein